MFAKHLRIRMVGRGGGDNPSLACRENNINMFAVFYGLKNDFINSHHVLCFMLHRGGKRGCFGKVS